MFEKKVVVIGGGFCGLISIHCLKEEDIEPVCFEKTSKPGGTWCYRKDSTIGIASIMPTTIINHSKEMGAMSDFPPKPEFHNYMRHHELYQYIMDYSEHYGLLRHIKYNTEVTRVRRTDDYEVTGRWEVTTRDLVTGAVTVDVYDGVLVCTGHVNRPKMPEYPGQREFMGKVLHTHSLKEVTEYAGQKVVVVGMGSSAIDAAVDISNVAKQVYLSTRNGAWVVKRIGPYGYPMDYTIMRRWMMWTLNYFPTSWLSRYVEKVYLNPYFDYDLYRVKPKHDFLSRDPIVNDSIFVKMISGSVIQMQDIERFTENGVIFKEENTVTEADAVIMGTGYTWGFPFLEEGVIVTENNRINLYKCIYPPHLKHPTLAILGFFFTFGAGFPVGEMQCRLAAHLMAGKSKLPSYDVMMKDIIHRHSNNEKRYRMDDKLSIRVDSLPYVDEISSMIGAKPDFIKMFFTDFWLFFKLFWGPWVPYQYRLDGPHKWDGARHAIMTCDDRVKAPFTGNFGTSVNKT